MGTIVLSPQDCLSSPHNRQNYHFPSAAMPDSGRRRSQALLVPLPAAEDCARRDFSGGSPPGDGLLPIPQSHGQARALSKKPPFHTKSSSIFCTPPAGRSATASPSPIVKSKLSRSASAILPTPLVSSPPPADVDGLHLLKGRLPFKLVQGNGLGTSKVDAVQHSNLKKPTEARNGPQKKTPAVTGHVVNAKAKGGLQGSRPTPKPPHDGTFLKGQPRKLDERTEKRLQRSHSVKGPHEKCDQNGGAPVITILQRPQSKEAAAELLTKFLQKSEQEVLCLKERSANFIPEDVQNHPEMIADNETEQRKGTDDSSDSVEGQVLLSPCRTTNRLGLATSKDLQGCSVVDAVSLAASHTLETQLGARTFNSTRAILGDVSEELASWERWAGPCYINSPPPSALPVPRFSRKQLKLESLVPSDLFEELVSDQASTPPSSISPLYACLSARRELGTSSDVVVTATKDLKRILNLDLCRM